MKLAPTLAALALALAAPATAHAFCGFYVAGGDQKMFNDATQVVLMRKGTRTVLSMQNNYQGPPDAFAMVVPVPVVLKEDDVKTLPREVFAQVEAMGAPRLVEYWEQDPCAPEPKYDEIAKSGAMPMPTAAAEGAPADDLGVKIEAQFTVGEYKIVILSAKDSTGLDTWLRREKYTIPADAEPLLRPYVESGSKFFVAKVDPQKVKFVGEGNDKRAQLSPLRFHYDTEEFSLPIRLGLASSPGTQDLIVNILAPQQRYDVANYKNVTIPTNIDVDPKMKDRFGELYAALFDRTVEKNPGAVITEYAWQATTCDPCPGPALDQSHFLTLGADVLDGAVGQVAPYGNADFVLTRLHARYGKSMTDDLRFKAAPPIVGGREIETGGQLEQGARSDSINNFQGRYAIRHPWTGPITCDKPQRGRWGGPNGADRPTTSPGLDLAHAPRGGLQLASAVLRDVPEIDVRVNNAAAKIDGAGSPSTPAPATPPKATKSGGCGCDAGGDPSLLVGFGLLLRGIVRPGRPRQRRAR
ncbi:MAG TPA: DUF2330 domain-containing protein [Kofleriaceae bacterium]|nr:DUF2330 domain-containing protein [Kofleriaceae bacterium]